MVAARYTTRDTGRACTLVRLSPRYLSIHTLVMCARISLAEMLPLESVSTLLNACSRRSTCGSAVGDGGWVWVWRVEWTYVRGEVGEKGDEREVIWFRWPRFGSVGAVGSLWLGLGREVELTSLRSSRSFFSISATAQRRSSSSVCCSRSSCLVSSSATCSWSAASCALLMRARSSSSTC